MFNKTAFKFISSFVAILVASFTVFAALGYYENKDSESMQIPAISNTNTAVSSR